MTTNTKPLNRNVVRFALQESIPYLEALRRLNAGEKPQRRAPSPFGRHVQLPTRGERLNYRLARVEDELARYGRQPESPRDTEADLAEAHVHAGRLAAALACEYSEALALVLS